MSKVKRKTTSFLTIFFLIIFFFGITPAVTPDSIKQINQPTSAGTYVPSGLIALWAGSLSTIPSGWVLCDGTSGTLDMSGKFALMTNGVEDPGTSGGLAIHNHIYDTLPFHDHGYTSENSIPHDHSYIHPNVVTSISTGTHGTPIYEYDSTIPTEDHYFEHNHTTTSTGQLSCYTENSALMPPYYKLAFIEKINTEASIPNGVIVIWTDTVGEIPAGWMYCDGTSGTPDLRSQFIMGTKIEDVGDTGGLESHTHDYSDVPLHNHTTGKVGLGHSHDVHNCEDSGLIAERWIITEPEVSIINFELGSTGSASLDHSHSMSASGILDCETESANHLPPYSTVHFMMSNQVNTGLPVGAVAYWGDTLASVPGGWAQCDGTDGTVDLRDYYVRGASGSEPLGTTGGALTHYHAYTDVPQHTHSINSYTGSHTHSYNKYNFESIGIFGITATLGVSTEIIDTSTKMLSHSHDISPAGDPSPQTDPESNHPPFIELALIRQIEPTISLQWVDPASGETIYFGHTPTVSFNLNFTTTGLSDSITLWISNGIESYESGNIKGQSSVAIPNLSGGITATLRFWYNGVQITDVTRTFTFINNRDPTVSITYPNGGQTIDGVVDILWGSSDPDGDTLYSTLQYNVNGGSWITIATDITGNSYSWNTTTIDNSENIRLRIAVDDTYGGTDADVSDGAFTIYNADPEPPPDPTPDPKIPGFNIWIMLSILVGCGILLIRKTHKNH